MVLCVLRFGLSFCSSVVVGSSRVSYNPSSLPSSLPPSLPPSGAGPVDDHGCRWVQRVQARDRALRREGGSEGGREGGREGGVKVCVHAWVWYLCPHVLLKDSENKKGKRRRRRRSSK